MGGLKRNAVFEDFEEVSVRTILTTQNQGPNLSTDENIPHENGFPVVVNMTKYLDKCFRKGTFTFCTLCIFWWHLI